jgi:uncharacterized membrane protein YdfJ with MMPL/SSD domain
MRYKITRPLVVGCCWLLCVAAALPFAARQSDHLTSGGFAVPGSQSARVETILARRYPAVARTSLAILLMPKSGASEQHVLDAIKAITKAVHDLRGVSVPRQSLERAEFAAGLIEPMLVALRVNENQREAQSTAGILRRRLENLHAAHNVQMYVLGEGAVWAALNETTKQDIAKAELIGFPIILVVLWLVFGSVAAATLPLALAAIAVVVAGAVIYGLSLLTELSVFTTNTASMLGVGVGVDYSLILLARVRQELLSGMDLRSACRIALVTSGRAIMFSGGIVVASLCGVWVIPNQSLRSMAIGAIVVVVIAVVVAVSLLPVLIGVLGSKRLSRRTALDVIRRRHGGQSEQGAGSRLRVMVDWVMAHSAVVALAVALPLGALCAVGLNMKTSTGALEQLPAGSSTKQGFREAARIAGAGALGPVDIVIWSRADPKEALRIANTLRAKVAHVGGVKTVGLPQAAANGRYELFAATLQANPESTKAKVTVTEIRRQFSRLVSRAGSSVTVAVGGVTATQLDEEQKVAGSMWKLFAVVLGLAFLVMMTLLRSIVLPLKAIVMNLFTVGAAYGVLVMVFQWGWLSDIFGLHGEGHIDTLIPPLILAVVFGLSMDYEIFLLSRIRERWESTADAKRAVAEGVMESAGTISSAALILVCVFGVFIGTGIPEIKELGLGAAVAIALDATVVRLLLVPAVMSLLGRWSWWWPRANARRYANARRHLQTDVLTEKE